MKIVPVIKSGDLQRSLHFYIHIELAEYFVAL